MVEGPGHVPFDQIEMNMKRQERVCDGAPFYVLGPVVTDVFPGYDHITSRHRRHGRGVPRAPASCATSRPAEHLALPTPEDVKPGLHRLQDRRPRRRRGPRPARGARLGRPHVRGPRRPRLAEASSSWPSTARPPAQSADATCPPTPTTAPCAAATGAPCASARNSSSKSSSGRRRKCCGGDCLLILHLVGYFGSVGHRTHSSDRTGVMAEWDNIICVDGWGSR